MIAAGRRAKGADPIRIIVGATASGKERLAIACTWLANGEIVSLDSMKVYRRLDIATAKPCAADRALIPHHCLDLADPTETFSAADYVRAADAAIRDVRSRGRTPFLSGGSAFYCQALLYGLFDGPGADPEVRRRLEERADREGSLSLHRELAETDPAAAAKIHPSDVRRVVRALEVAALTGAGISVRQTQWDGFHGTVRAGVSASSRHPFVMIRLVRNRDDIRERIRARTGRMAAAGLRDEAEWVFANRECLSRTLLQAVGYKEFFPFFRGESTWDEAMDRLCLASHRLVRKQETWFRKFPAREVFLYPDTNMDQLAEELNRTAFRSA